MLRGCHHLPPASLGEMGRRHSVQLRNGFYSCFQRKLRSSFCMCHRVAIRMAGRRKGYLSLQESWGESGEERDCPSPTDFRDGVSGC